jgi:hypothetical protein
MIDHLTGKTDHHIIQSSHFQRALHRQVETPLKKLQLKAQQAGFDLQILSGFRSYDAQLSIWNRKANGERPLLDTNETPLDISALNPEEIVNAILRWSAIPGASRHHWGTDIDIYDGNTIPEEGYDIQLISDEVEPNGIFGKLHLWLDQLICDGESEGFFRPYDKDRGGVAPEKWHLSFAPLSERYLRDYTLVLFEQTVTQSDINLKEILLQDIERYYQQYVLNIGS